MLGILRRSFTTRRQNTTIIKKYILWSNKARQGTKKVGEISKKVQHRRLKCYGHVMRRQEHHVGRRTMGIEVQGKGGEDDYKGEGGEDDVREG